MIIVKTSSKGQLVLPKSVRKSLDLRPGQKVSLKVVGDHAEIKPLPPDPIGYLCGIFKDHPTSLAEQLLIERRKDLDHEEEKIIRLPRRLGLSETGKRLRKS